MRVSFPRVASLKDAATLRAHLAANGIALPFDDQLLPPAESPLGRPIALFGQRVGNRFAILPMEGWDGTAAGEPTDLTIRRWRHFGASGAKLIWGGEAVAVRHDGRASPRQLLLTRQTQAAIAGLRDALVAEHRGRFGSDADRDLLIGLQLTHSGRFAKPDADDRAAPLTACVHPLLDRRFTPAPRLLSDDDLDRLVDDFVAAARIAADIGFRFIDLKQCHGYLGHELLGARTREGRYGGTLENRCRFAEKVIDGIRAEAPALQIAVRISAFDVAPFRKTADGTGERDDSGGRPANGFGLVWDDDLPAALTEPMAVLRRLAGLDVRLICITGGSPYYSPHFTRPAYFPPLDGYLPPEDPLRGVARQIQATATIKAALPELTVVGSGYSYLQEWLPHVAQRTVGDGHTDFVGLGRMVLAYPDFAADVLAGRPLRRASFCRTFSDCTTGPRLGFVSGCYPLDPQYESRPEATQIRQARTRMTTR